MQVLPLLNGKSLFEWDISHVPGIPRGIKPASIIGGAMLGGAVLLDLESGLAGTKARTCLRAVTKQRVGQVFGCVKKILYDANRRS